MKRNKALDAITSANVQDAEIRKRFIIFSDKLKARKLIDATSNLMRLTVKILALFAKKTLMFAA